MDKINDASATTTIKYPNKPSTEFEIPTFTDAAAHLYNQIMPNFDERKEEPSFQIEDIEEFSDETMLKQLKKDREDCPQNELQPAPPATDDYVSAEDEFTQLLSKDERLNKRLKIAGKKFSVSELIPSRHDLLKYCVPKKEQALEILNTDSRSIKLRGKTPPYNNC